MRLKWFFVKIARIWFCFKRITVGNDALEWGHVCFKSPPDSEREKLAFRRVIEILATHRPEILKIYPDYSPPNILRKIALDMMYAYVKRQIAVIFFESMNIFGGGKLSKYAKEEINSCQKKYYLWENFFISKPDSKEEEIALQKLKEGKEISSKMVFRNYLITIE